MPPVIPISASSRDASPPSGDADTAAHADSALQPFSLGPWQVDPARGELRRGDTVQHLEPKMVDVLIELARRPGEVVSKETILDAVWPDVTVGHHAFWRCIAGLRKALGDDARAPRFIETIPHRGYRLVASPGLLRRPEPAIASDPGRRGGVWMEPRQQVGVRPAIPVVVLLTAVVLTALATAVVPRLAPSIQPPPAIAPLAIALAPFEIVAPIPASVKGAGTNVGESAAVMTDALRIAIGALPGVVLVAEDEQPGIAYRLVGTLRADRGDIVLAVRLLQAPAERQIWAGRFEPETADSLDLERYLAQAVAAEIAVQLPRLATPHLPLPPSRGAEMSAATDRLVERGRTLWRRRSAHDLRGARDTFRAALDFDPSNARAWAGLADAESLLAQRSRARPARRFAAARAAAERALRLDPGLAEAHAALGFVALNQDWDFTAAESAYRRALAIDPDNATARQWNAELLAFRGRYDEALIEIEHAWRADTEATIVQAVWGRLLTAAGQYEAAYRRLRAALVAGAPFPWLYSDLATACARLGRVEESLTWRLRWLAAAGVAPAEVEALEQAIAAHGIHAFWRFLLDNGGGAASRAAAYAALGEREYALAALSEAARGRGEGVLHLAFDPAFDSLRSHPRFAALTGGVGAHAAAGHRGLLTFGRHSS